MSNWVLRDWICGVTEAGGELVMDGLPLHLHKDRLIDCTVSSTALASKSSPLQGVSSRQAGVLRSAVSVVD